jgi:hypothetical protein
MASAIGRLRAGFFTSAAANVTLFQASLENNEPTSAAPISFRCAHGSTHNW